MSRTLLPRRFAVTTEVRKPYPDMPDLSYTRELRARSAGDAMLKALKELEDRHTVTLLAGVDMLVTVSGDEQLDLSFADWEEALRSVGKANGLRELVDYAATLAEGRAIQESERQRAVEEHRLREERAEVLANLAVSRGPRQRPSGLAD